MYCSKCGAEVIEGEKVCPMCGGELVEHEVTPENGLTRKQPDLSMGWYKFVRIMLIAWALLNVKSAIDYINGTAYGFFSDWIYDTNFGARTIDIVYGALLIVHGAYMIFTSIRLWRYCKNGPKLLTCSFGITVTLSVLYTLVTAMVCNISISVVLNSLTLMLPAIAVNVILMIANAKYFKKRAHLFEK